MNSRKSRSTRRVFLQRGSTLAALAATAVPRVHAAEDNTIRVALVGCGGRGTGAAANALSVRGGPIRLVAMADVFEERLKSSHHQLKQQFAQQCDVPEDRKFIGLDAYRRAIDCLQPGDVVILATPPAFRWPHFAYAIEKAVHVFMEKPVTVDGPTTKRMILLADEAAKKNLKVGVGLMWRHCRPGRNSADRFKTEDRRPGDAARYSMPIRFFAARKPDRINHLMYQISGFHAFLWASGCYSDFYIHNIDGCAGSRALPIAAHSLGGRHFRGDSSTRTSTTTGQIHFSDGTKLFLFGRCMAGCESHLPGTCTARRGWARFPATSPGGALPDLSGHDPVDAKMLWKAPPEQNPYQLEWDDLVGAIRADRPYNEARRGAEASLVTSMGRMAAHTGRTVTYDEIAQSDHEFAPGADQFTADSPAPLQPDAEGKYPVPQPGLVTQREY